MINKNHHLKKATTMQSIKDKFESARLYQSAGMSWLEALWEAFKK